MGECGVSYIRRQLCRRELGRSYVVFLLGQGRDFLCVEHCSLGSRDSSLLQYFLSSINTHFPFTIPCFCVISCICESGL